MKQNEKMLEGPGAGTFLRKQLKRQIARAELWLARHPDEDPAILERYRARIHIARNALSCE